MNKITVIKLNLDVNLFNTIEVSSLCFDHEDEKNTRHSVLTREKDVLLGLVEARNPYDCAEL